MTEALRLNTVAFASACVVLCSAFAVMAQQPPMHVPPGPVLTDTQLFEAIDLSAPGLEAVQKAVSAGDHNEAVSALATYYRQRPTPWFFDPQKPVRDIDYDKQTADDAVNGKVRVVNITYTFPDGEIDWYYNATSDRDDLAFNNEWHWQLNRMYFWPELGNAYWATGDEKYAEAWVHQFRKWVITAPVPNELAEGRFRCWRTLEAGLRMSDFWPNAFLRFLKSPTLTDRDIVDYVKSTQEHGRWLYRSHNDTPNQLAMEMNGLYTAACLFPELKEADAWRKRAVKELDDGLEAQFLPDGVHNELAICYHNVAVDHLMGAYDKSRIFGLEHEFSTDFLARMEKAFDFNLHFMTPDRLLPRTNDCWGWGIMKSMKDGVKYFPQRDDYRWFATHGQEGQPPKTTSHFFPYAGYIAMRSDWDTDANMLFFDVGPLGVGCHSHQDSLQILLWAYGREMLADGGGGAYEHSKWREFAVNAHSHNVAVVDGEPQWKSNEPIENQLSEQPIDAGWISNDKLDYAQGVYDDVYAPPVRQIRPSRHTRRVLSVKPDVFIVTDNLETLDGKPHQYDIRWHVDSLNTSYDAATGIVATEDVEKPNLAIVPLFDEQLNVRAVSGQEEPEILGYYVDKFGPRKITTVQHIRHGKDEHFATLLLPLRKGESHDVKSVQEDGGTLIIQFNDGRQVAVENIRSPRLPLRIRE